MIFLIEVAARPKLDCHCTSGRCCSCTGSPGEQQGPNCHCQHAVCISVSLTSLPSSIMLQAEALDATAIATALREAVASSLLPPECHYPSGRSTLTVAFVKPELLQATLQVSWQGHARSAAARRAPHCRCCQASSSLSSGCSCSAQSLPSPHTAGPGCLAGCMPLSRRCLGRPASCRPCCPAHVRSPLSGLRDTLQAPELQATLQQLQDVGQPQMREAGTAKVLAALVAQVKAIGQHLHAGSHAWRVLELLCGHATSEAASARWGRVPGGGCSGNLRQLVGLLDSILILLLAGSVPGSAQGQADTRVLSAALLRAGLQRMADNDILARMAVKHVPSYLADTSVPIQSTLERAIARNQPSLLPSRGGHPTDPLQVTKAGAWVPLDL